MTTKNINLEILFTRVIKGEVDVLVINSDSLETAVRRAAERLGYAGPPLRITDRLKVLDERIKAPNINGSAVIIDHLNGLVQGVNYLLDNNGLPDKVSTENIASASGRLAMIETTRTAGILARMDKPWHPIDIFVTHLLGPADKNDWNTI